MGTGKVNKPISFEKDLIASVKNLKFIKVEKHFLKKIQ